LQIPFCADTSVRRCPAGDRKMLRLVPLRPSFAARTFARPPRCSIFRADLGWRKRAGSCVPVPATLLRRAHGTWSDVFRMYNWLPRLVRLAGVRHRQCAREPPHGHPALLRLLSHRRPCTAGAQAVQRCARAHALWGDRWRRLTPVVCCACGRRYDRWRAARILERPEWASRLLSPMCTHEMLRAKL
jgi:hypothetical protein